MCPSNDMFHPDNFVGGGGVGINGSHRPSRSPEVPGAHFAEWPHWYGPLYIYICVYVCM